MEESLKISIPKEVNDILEKDAISFNFLKNNGNINKNRLCNVIFMNYHDRFKKEIDDRTESIQKILDNNDIILKQEEKFINDVLNYIETIESNKFCGENKKESRVIRIHFNKDTLGVFHDFYNTFIKAKSKVDRMSIPEAFRRLFASYVALPFNEREKVVFRKTEERIKNGIEEKKVLTLYRKNRISNVLPYKLVCSNEEMYNYLLCKDLEKDKLITYRLTYIEDVIVLGDKFEGFSESEIACFEQSIKQGPQFMIEDLDQFIKVKFTQEGLYQYQRRYLYRPSIYQKLDDNIILFQCSLEQAFKYFSKFKGDATVLEPESLVERIRQEASELLSIYEK